jgi:hypothetical protein
MNENTDMSEPDLDRPGLYGQTVRHNLQDLATSCGSEEDVTREACEEAGLDWRDWSYFVVETIEHDRWTDEHMASYEANYEAKHGNPAPGMAELRAHLRKDKLGLTHLVEDDQDEETDAPPT